MPPTGLSTDARSAARQRQRVAIATAGLATAALMFLPSVARAFAASSTDRGGVAAGPVAHRAAPEPTTSTSAALAPVAAGQEAVLEIPSLKLSLPVVRGGQGVIDEGVVAHYSESRSRPAVDPGQPGTYWLAAHNSSTHGSPFGPLPAIADGAHVRIKTLGGATFTYTITSRELVGSTTTQATVYGPDTTTPRILLQTCRGASQRLLVHGVLASETFASVD
jgi:LPXTG-site transpeptidase (sortase) family protein